MGPQELPRAKFTLVNDPGFPVAAGDQLVQISRHPAPADVMDIGSSFVSQPWISSDLMVSG
jgi:hypothetical protein